MRIAYVHQHFSVLGGSTGNRSYWFAKKLVERGHSVTVICGSSNGCDSGLSQPYRFALRTGFVEGLRVIQFQVRYSNGFGGWQRTLAFIAFALFATSVVLARKFDVVVASSTPLTVAVPALAAKKFRGSKMVFEVRDLWPDLLIEMGGLSDPLQIRSLYSLETFAYKRSDYVVALAPGILERVRKVRGMVEGSSLIPNGSDLELFEVTRKRRAVRIKSGFDGIKCVYAGAFGKANGLDFILEVASQIDLSGDGRVCISLVGTGSEKDRLEETATRLGLRSLNFVEPISKSRLPEFFGEFDLGLQILAPYEGFKWGTSPNKFFDYIAAGMPVMTNYSGWVSELVTSSGAGLLVSNPKKFAERLLFLSENPSELAAMGENAFKLAERQFARDTLADEFAVRIEGVSGR